MNSKYDFYDIVKVLSNDSKHIGINGKLGFILGKAENEETGKYSYGVSIYDTNGKIWRIQEKDLQPTGKKANPKDFYTGDKIKVSVNPKTGEGEIIEGE